MIRIRAFLSAAVLPAAALLAQPSPAPSPFAQAVDAEITKLEKQFVPLAQAMPPEKFDFTPESLRIPGSELAGVRTFAGQVRHVAADNFAIWAPVSGKPEPAGIDAPNGPATMTSRAEILDFLQRSFAFSHEAARRLTSANALDLVDFRGSKVTQLSLVALGISHAMDHYGQMVEYLRLSGTAPPGSRPRSSPAAVSGASAPEEQSVSDESKRTETLRRYGLDPTSPLESRVAATPASVLKMFEELGPPAPTPHSLAPEERKQLDEALAALPPLHRRVLSERLRTLSFLDGMPNTALTSTVNPDGDYKLFDITLRAGVFRQTVSEWLTEKERTCFDGSGSPLSVSIEAGSKPAIVYALLHEATHVVDSSLHVNPVPAEGGRPGAAADTSAFTRGVWADASTPAASYRDPLLESSHFRQGGRVLPIADAERVYEALERTPFASFYGSRNWFDDLAEYVALYEMTHALGQPYRIVLQRGGRPVVTYEPMKSRLVLARAARIPELLTPGGPQPSSSS